MTTAQTTDANDHDEFEPAPPDKLYAHHCRQLSAMMDGELSPDEARFMLRRLEHDAALAGCWERWQVCSDVLRGRRHSLLPADFAQRVALAIADDDRAAVAVSANAAAKSKPRLARWGGGAALAASVAVVAFLVARQLPGDPASAPETPAAVVARTPAAPAQPQPTPAPIPAETATRMADASLPPEAGIALATTAVAAAEAPRRASERRAREQARRAPDRVQVRDVPVQVQPPVALAANLPALALPTEPAPSANDPFAALPVAPARPWPRAILSGYPASGAFSAGYGNAGASAGFDPFQPHLQPGIQADAVPTLPDSEPGGADTGSADGGVTEPRGEARDGTTPY